LSDGQFHFVDFARDGRTTDDFHDKVSMMLSCFGRKTLFLPVGSFIQHFLLTP
jgi:hypothetical protein